jgi:SAM-dependent methyltransferase
MTSPTDPTVPVPETDPERFDPARAGGLLIDAEHRARYWAAAALAAGRRVLDAGCGTGYGTETLAAAGARSVSAIDVAQEAVDVTRRRLGDRFAAEVVRADLHELPFPDGAFDLVVCFEVIEHVEDQDGAIAELRRVLAPDGVLALSSPNRLVYPAGNPHHLHEYTPDELDGALRAQFAHVALHRQHVWMASALLTADQAATPGALALTPQLLEPIAPGQETYTVALAGDAPLPDLAAQVALGGAGELRWLRDEMVRVDGARREEVGRLLREQERARAELRDFREQRARTGARLLDLEAENAQLPELVRRLSEVMEERRAYEAGVHVVLAEKDADIERARSIMEGLQASFSWRITRPVRAVKKLLRPR